MQGRDVAPQWAGVDCVWAARVLRWRKSFLDVSPRIERAMTVSGDAEILHALWAMPLRDLERFVAGHGQTRIGVEAAAAIADELPEDYDWDAPGAEGEL